MKNDGRRCRRRRVAEKHDRAGAKNFAVVVLPAQNDQLPEGCVQNLLAMTRVRRRRPKVSNTCLRCFCARRGCDCPSERGGYYLYLYSSSSSSVPIPRMIDLLHSRKYRLAERHILYYAGGEIPCKTASSVPWGGSPPPLSLSSRAR